MRNDFHNLIAHSISDGSVLKRGSRSWVAVHLLRKRCSLGESDACLAIHSVYLPQSTHIGSCAQVQAQVVLSHCLHDLLRREGERESERAGSDVCCECGLH